MVNEGLLQFGQVFEIGGQDLISTHVGGTGAVVAEKFGQAEDWVLFIDEVYSLLSSQAAQEAIDVLTKISEDQMGRFCVILAGYEDEMKSFLGSNAGLRSRFMHQIVFPDMHPQISQVVGTALFG